MQALKAWFAMMHRVPRTGLTAPAVGVSLSEGLGVAFIVDASEVGEL
jgi:hypothetical protein